MSVTSICNIKLLAYLYWTEIHKLFRRFLWYSETTLNLAHFLFIPLLFSFHSQKTLNLTSVKTAHIYQYFLCRHKDNISAFFLVQTTMSMSWWWFFVFRFYAINLSCILFAQFIRFSGSSTIFLAWPASSLPCNIYECIRQFPWST